MISRQTTAAIKIAQKSAQLGDDPVGAKQKFLAIAPRPIGYKYQGLKVVRRERVGVQVGLCCRTLQWREAQRATLVEAQQETDRPIAQSAFPVVEQHRARKSTFAGLRHGKRGGGRD